MSIPFKEKLHLMRVEPPLCEYDLVLHNAALSRKKRILVNLLVYHRLKYAMNSYSKIDIFNLVISLLVVVTTQPGIFTEQFFLLLDKITEMLDTQLKKVKNLKGSDAEFLATVDNIRSSECPICLSEQMSKPVHFRPCGHGMCSTCFQLLQKHYRKLSCPMCRKMIGKVIERTAVDYHDFLVTEREEIADKCMEILSS